MHKSLFLFSFRVPKMGAKAENERHVSFFIQPRSATAFSFRTFFQCRATRTRHYGRVETRLRLPLRAAPKKGQRLRDSERFSSLVRDKPVVQGEGDNALSAELNHGAMPISMSIWMCELGHRSARTSDAPLCGLSRQVHTIRNRGAIHDPD